MYSFKALALAAPFLVPNTNAQNVTSDPGVACPRLEDIFKYNSSTTRTMQALRLSGPRPATDESGRLARFSIENDTSRTWELSLRVRSHSFDPSAKIEDYEFYNHAIFLDTGDSNMTNIGSCHQTIQPEQKSFGSRFLWTREALERSQDDNGDCTSILSAGCIKALKEQAANQAAEWPLRTGRCSNMNTTMPLECTSEVGKQLSNSEMNLTHLSEDWAPLQYNAKFDPALKCNDVNLSSTHSVAISHFMTYDVAVRFPSIDVITFWPNRESGLSSYVNGWEYDVHVELVCMRPDSNIAEWSDTPLSASEVLDKENATFPTPTPAVDGASTLRSGTLGWIAVFMGIMFVM